MQMRWLSIERARARHGVPADRPLVLAERAGSSQRVAACCRLARDAGVRVGQSVAEARAVVPAVVVCRHDRVADRGALEALASRAMRFSPIVQPVEPNVLLADVSGCERLFGGERRLLERAMEQVRQAGFSVCGAIADTVGAAWAVAHAGQADSCVVRPGQQSAVLAGLGVWSLRLELELVEALGELGIQTVGDLMGLPRSSLAERFGRAVLERLDQALGAVPELIEPFEAAVPPAARMGLAFATQRREVLEAAVRHLLEGLLEGLRRRGQGIVELNCTFYREQARPMTVGIWLTRPSQSLGHLVSLLRLRMEAVDLSIPVEAVSVHVLRVGAVLARQGCLFGSAAEDCEPLAAVLERLANRLGRRAVVRAELEAEHQPELAWRARPVVGADGSDDGSSRRELAAGLRPLRLLARPRPIEVIAAATDHCPGWFRWAGREHRVVEAIGPERIETGWWRGEHICRDYYLVEDEAGRRFWIFRDIRSRRWLLHGCFE